MGLEFCNGLSNGFQICQDKNYIFIFYFCKIGFNFLTMRRMLHNPNQAQKGLLQKLQGSLNPVFSPFAFTEAVQLNIKVSCYLTIFHKLTRLTVHYAALSYNLGMCMWHRL